jgi:predicted metal-dependent hydrolase
MTTGWNAAGRSVTLVSHARVPPQHPPRVEVRRSPRRRRTVSAYRDGDRTVVLIPARMTRAEESEWVAAMVARLDARDRRTRPSDDELMARARTLADRYLPGAAPSSVRWVANQTQRWGSCTVDDGSIRLSTRLRGMPEWVIDYVLLHELAHLRVPGHGPDFWALLTDFPYVERARGFLEGWTAAGEPVNER